MIQAQTRPKPNWPCQNSQNAASTSRKPAKVTWLGRRPATAHQRVTIRAGTGHQYLVTTSVTPLYEPAKVRASTARTLSGVRRTSTGGSRLRKASL